MARVVEFPEGDGDPVVHEDGASWQEPVSDAELARVAVAKKPTPTQARAAANMRFAGAPWDEIADFFDYKDAAVARQVVEAHIAKAYPDESRESLYKLTGIRLDQLWQIAARHLGDTVQIEDPEYGVKIVPNPEQIAWTKTGMDVLDRIAKLHGLNAPTKVEVSPDAEKFETVVSRLVAIARGEDEAIEADVVEYAEIVDTLETGEL